MAIAALPNYMGSDHSGASPGMRFGMYLPLWGVDGRTGQPQWTTHDTNYRADGPAREERAFKDENKTAALRATLELSPADKAHMNALALRQSTLAAVLEHSRQLLTLEARSVAPFSTGLGNEHPLENGFAFLNPYGLPYLPGSGVKGVLRQAARELARGDWGDTKAWSDDSITALFGKQGDDGDTDHLRGALMFWDVLPQIPGGKLQVEVMTPHQSHYYQNGQTPHESGQPIPINFLTVPPHSAFVFHVQCDVKFLRGTAAGLATDRRWQTLLRAAFEHAFDWLGFGAKTAVGYGAMREDQEAKARQQQKAEALRKDQETREAAMRREEQISRMPLERQPIQKFLDERADKNVTELAALLLALKKGQWQGESRIAAAEFAKDLMVAAKKWKERTEKKNPDKDYDYGDTQLVQKWLKGN